MEWEWESNFDQIEHQQTAGKTCLPQSKKLMHFNED